MVGAISTRLALLRTRFPAFWFCGHFPGRPLREARFARRLPWGMKSGVIHRKAALEARCKSILRIERQRPDKRRSAITASTKQVRHEGKARGQPATQLAGSVCLR